ncbi:AhpC/TSA family protein [Carboxylicivirga mesophila]|uniref:AhpC/TSA family protein n=1 Tax=Carboxylicivirga mesophila TaxID=1166478 RepID=A0ABS5K9H0_9BACT|nr:TlpA disulfide reductase family protein [Carboxylicivirga mesophila]MBS2211641.1 AhpC/TSA family protein [Carboxylicivirga mesophila]
MKELLKLLFITLILSSCKTSNDGFIINGHIEGLNDSTLITLYDLDQEVNLDSAISINGNFKLSGKVEYPTSCWIKCLDEYANIQVENVDITFESPIKDMHLNSAINGGKEQELQNKLKKLQRPYDLIYFGAVDSFMNKKYSDDVEMQNLIKRFSESQSASHEIYVDFGKKHSNSFYGLNIVYMNRQSIPRDTLEAIFQNLPVSIESTPTAKALNVYLYEKIAKIGDSFIDFEANTIDGQQFKLSSLKGQYIYLSFWSAGCRPCRMENKYLSENFDQVPDNLSIVSFSVDKNKAAWVNASKADNINWHNVSDNAGTKGKIKTQYQVQAIPTSFLIDKDGVIIKKFKGFDRNGNLIEKLKETIDKI